MIGRAPNYLAGEVALSVVFEQVDLFPLLGKLGGDVWMAVSVEIMNTNIDQSSKVKQREML